MRDHSRLFGPRTFLATVLGLLSVLGSAQAQTGIDLPPHDDELFKASCPSPWQLLDRSVYRICYEPEDRIAVWVGYDLTPTLLEGAIERTDDLDLPLTARAELSD